MKIKEGIVFSNDVERIISGNNALNYSYEKNGIVLPNDISDLRKSFLNDTNKIFNGKVTIISEDEMLCSLYESIQDVFGRYPHNIFRQNLFNCW